MIRYALTCGEGHAFEAWFGSAAAFDRQSRANAITCPACGNARVEKAPMAPYVSRARASVPSAPEPGPSYAMLRKLRAALTANSDYVGARFPEEARKIHYEEAASRNIHGEATPEEARALDAEGIAIVPLPRLPEDRN